MRKYVATSIPVRIGARISDRESPRSRAAFQGQRKKPTTSVVTKCRARCKRFSHSALAVQQATDIREQDLSSVMRQSGISRLQGPRQPLPTIARMARLAYSRSLKYMKTLLAPTIVNAAAGTLLTARSTRTGAVREGFGAAVTIR